MEGIIIKGVAGQYEVRVGDQQFTCKARGIFKKKGIKPLVGDKVRISIDDYDDSLGIVEDVLPRSTSLIRPPVANVTQAVVVFAVSRPEPNINLLDKLLAICEFNGLDVVLCLNKVDLDSQHLVGGIEEIYKTAGYKVITTSAKAHIEIDALKEALANEISVFAGPSGVGKSSLLNEIKEGAKLEVGGLSEKIGRGKHTTRHSELMVLPCGGMVVDTPGFTAMDISQVPLEDLSQCYVDFLPYLNSCKFNNCMHINEPGCAVKEAVDNKEIHTSRYASYIYFVKALEEHRRYKSW